MGRSDYRVIFESLYRTGRRKAQDLIGRATAMASGSSDRNGGAPSTPAVALPDAYNTVFVESFQRFARRGVPVLFALGELDRETEDFHRYFEPTVLSPGNPYVGVYETYVIKGASHTLAEGDSEQDLFRQVERFLDERRLD
jgi:hypothetical protein